MKKLVLILFAVLMNVGVCFGQLDYDHRVFTKQYGTVAEGRSLWGDVRVVKEGFADFYVYVNTCLHCHDYDLNITLVDGRAERDQWHILHPTSKTKEWFSVRFVKTREAADFVIRIDNPGEIPEWLRDVIRVNP